MSGVVGVALPFKKKGIDAAEYEMTEVSLLNEGDSFGELALLNGSPRTAEVHCKTECEVAVLTKEYFSLILSMLL